MSSTLKDRLLEARKASGYSQRELAEKVGMKQSTYQALEAVSGKSQGTTLLPQMAFVLGVNAYWLATGEGPKEQGSLLDSQERELIDAWRLLPEQSKQTVLIQFRALRQSVEKAD